MVAPQIQHPNSAVVPSRLEVCTAFCLAGYTISGNATVLICGEGPDSSNGYTEYMPGTEDPGLYHLRARLKELLPNSELPCFSLAIS